MINDKVVSPKTYEKYRQFLEKHPTINIRKDEDDFNIHLSNAKEFRYALPQINMDVYETVLSDFVASL